MKVTEKKSHLMKEFRFFTKYIVCAKVYYLRNLAIVTFKCNKSECQNNEYD